MQQKKQRPLRRNDASKYLQEIWGLRRAPGTLGQDAVHGTGSDFFYVNGLPYYWPAGLDAWAKVRLQGKPANRAQDHKRIIGTGMRSRTAPHIVRGRQPSLPEISADI
jgi:hypothetical protein